MFFRVVMDLGLLGAWAYLAILNGPPEGEGLRVRSSALGQTLLGDGVTRAAADATPRSWEAVR